VAGSAVLTALRRARAGRVALEVDGRPWRVVPDEVALAAGLRAGLVLDRAALRRLRRELRRVEAMEAAARVLAHRDLAPPPRRSRPPANRALHMIAVCRLRYCDRTRAYAARRTAEGLSKKEIIRCLKRYIARDIYHTLRADITALERPT
jgi:hypothetical protein